MPRKAQGPRLVPIKRKGYGRSVYVIRYWDGERTRERSTGQEEIEAAEAVFEIWRAKRSGIHRTGPRHPAQRKIDDMLTTYAEERSPAVADADRILQIVSNLLDWWSDSNADAITEATCNAYVAHRLSQGRAIGTARRELAGLRAAVKWDGNKGRLLNPPHVFLPPRPPGDERWLTRSEAASLLKAARSEPKARQHLGLFILIALYTGSRRGAILDLRWTQVDLVHGKINFNPAGRTQTKKRRPTIPVPRQLLWFLRKAHKRATSDHVIAYRGKPVLRNRRSFTTAARVAGLDGVTSKTLRHTAGTWMAQSGVPLWQIAGYLGHSYERTTELYAHHHADYLGEARAAMERRGTAAIGGIS